MSVISTLNVPNLLDFLHSAVCKAENFIGYLPVKLANKSHYQQVKIWDQATSLTCLFAFLALNPEPRCGLQHVETLMFHKHDNKLENDLFLLLVQLCGTTCRPMSWHQRRWQCLRVASRLSLVCCVLHSLNCCGCCTSDIVVRHHCSDFHRITVPYKLSYSNNYYYYSLQPTSVDNNALVIRWHYW